jgi:CheY-like chemotaxis protein
VAAMVQSHHQHLSVHLPALPVWLDADPVRLAQVIGNLLNNASKYTPQGGWIELIVERQDDQVLIRVRDNGIGITPQLLPHVFELFVQDQRTIDRAQGGLGIGLTVVSNLVEMHGGTVTAVSQGRDHGSEFVVRLPVVTPYQATTGQQQPNNAATPLRILVVDDNVSAAKMLSLLLQKVGGHEVIAAHDGVAAIAAAKQHRPDLILLDIGLPKLDGFEVTRQLRLQPEFKNTHIAALTGYGTQEDRRKSLGAGFNDHLVKPPAIEELQKILADVRAART